MFSHPKANSFSCIITLSNINLSQPILSMLLLSRKHWILYKHWILDKSTVSWASWTESAFICSDKSSLRDELGGWREGVLMNKVGVERQKWYFLKKPLWPVYLALRWFWGWLENFWAFYTTRNLFLLFED